MIQVSNEELVKINEFIAGCNDIINGKFLLADMKITKLLNMIAGSEELYRYINECMNGYDFSRELHKAEMKNGLNGGSFAVPQNPDKLVAFVFCLLVECDAKRIDFYTFINENFISKDRSDVYSKFANTLLVPFRDTISSHFGLSDYANEQYKQVEQNYKEDIMEQSPFANEYDNHQQYEESDYNEEYEQNDGAMQTEQEYEMPKFSSTMQNDNTWQKIPEICDNVKDCIASQRHLNSYLRDELDYIIDTIKYSVKYKDAKITSALITAFDEMSKKLRQVQFVFGELKNEIQNLYK